MPASPGQGKGAGMNSHQLELPISVPEEDRVHHPFEPWNYSGDMNTPLGCKRCLKVLWHPIHSRVEGSYEETP